MNLAVTIEYLEVGAEKSRLVSVPPDRFFDADGVPEFHHEHECLDIDPARLCWTLLEVTGGDEPYRVRTQYFARGAGWMTHRTDADGSEEIIHVLRAPDGAEIILRTTRPASQEWMVISGGKIQAGEDSDLLHLRDHYHYDGIMPAHVPGSFATVSHPEHDLRGPWPAPPLPRRHPR